MTELEPGDRVKVGFSTGTVYRVEGARVLVTIDDKCLPHWVPVANVRKLED